MKAFTANPREGWVRASSVAGPEVTAELIRLSSENADLRKRALKAEETVAGDKREEIQQTLTTLFATKRTPSYRYTSSGEWHTDSEILLFEVFELLGPEMMVEASVEDMSGTLAMSIRTDKDKPWNLVAVNQVRELFADLMTLGLVQPSTRKHAVSDPNEYWSLSTYGVEILKRVRMLTLKEELEEQPEPDPKPQSPESPSQGTVPGSAHGEVQASSPIA